MSRVAHAHAPLAATAHAAQQKQPVVEVVVAATALDVQREGQMMTMRSMALRRRLVMHAWTRPLGLAATTTDVCVCCCVRVANCYAENELPTSLLWAE